MAASTTVGPYGGGRAGIARSVVLLVRSCSVRFTAYYWVGFTAGLLAGGGSALPWVLLGAPMWLALCVGTESVNRIADREADVVNQPERTRLCEEFGWARLTGVAIGSWTCFALFGAALLWTSPSVVLAVLLVADMAIAICYSVGPALKRHRVLSLATLITPVVMPVLTGWAVEGDTGVLLSPVLPVAAVLAAFTLGLSGIKDITDVEGDRALGYSSLWMLLARLRRGAAVYLLTAAPHLLVVVFVLTGALPPTALALLPLAVVSVLVVKAAARARVPADRAAAREVMHQFTFYFLAFALAAAAPRPAVAAVAAAAVAYWLVASRFLHWSGGLKKDQLVRWRHLLTATS
ncbi:UbiA family prenyltransferase [Streptomyces sp. SID8352]|uniref:UbiA family prenyltransferase n=1 Tax=Streptomyces sp. SID8352 TaxID=2690338 RepID=UPI00136BFC34|nr:UbiA family prenyltransferase [Streptomyces sp. SID8352]MYU21288.1 hypothetical protein [Streptomyces sp. SID8352]